MKDGNKDRNVFFLLLILMVLFCTGCGSPETTSFIGPQAVVTSGSITMSLSTDKTMIGLSDTLAITVGVDCGGICPEGDYLLSYSTNSRLKPSSNSTKNSVTRDKDGTLKPIVGGFSAVFSGVSPASEDATGTAIVTGTFSGLGTVLSTAIMVEIE